MREIDLIDMLYSIMKKWRIYILVLLIGFAVVFAYSYFQANSEYNHQMAAINNNTNTEYNPEKAVTDEQKNNVEKLLYSQEYLENRIEYSQNSLYSNLDPYNVPVLEILYKITTTSDTRTHQTVLAYEKIINNSDFRQILADALGIGEEYVSEIYSLRQSDSEQNIPTNITNIPINIINISIYGKSEEQLKTVAEVVDNYIKDAQTGILSEFAPYTVERISSAIGYIVDNEMLSNQNSLKTEIFNLKTDINAKKTALTSEEQAYYNYLNVDKIGKTQVAIPSKPALPIKKSVLVGIVLAIMVAFVYCMLYIFSPTLKKSERFDQLYKVNDLGSIKADKQSTLSTDNEKTAKKTKNPIDKLIDKIFDAYYRHNYNIESNFDLIALKLNIPAIKESGKKLAIVSTTADSSDKAYNLEKAVKQHGIETAVFTEFMHNPKMLQSFNPEESLVVILEEAEKSEYKEVENEVNYLNRINANVIGGIMIR